jgi:hypothetical protein
MEVLPVRFIENGTAVTQVEIQQLHAHHRRTKRDVEKFKLPLKTNHVGKEKKYPVSHILKI